MNGLVTTVGSRSPESQCGAVSPAPPGLSAQGPSCGPPPPAEMGDMELFEISVCIPGMAMSHVDSCADAGNALSVRIEYIVHALFEAENRLRFSIAVAVSWLA